MVYGRRRVSRRGRNYPRQARNSRYSSYRTTSGSSGGRGTARRPFYSAAVTRRVRARAPEMKCFDHTITFFSSEGAYSAPDEKREFQVPSRRNIGSTPTNIRVDTNLYSGQMINWEYYFNSPARLISLCPQGYAQNTRVGLSVDVRYLLLNYK